MQAERLVEMVNDIAAFFASDPDPATAADGIAQHLRRFWDPRMRQQLLEHLNQHQGEGLSPLGTAGVQALAKLQAPAQS